MEAESVPLKLLSSTFREVSRRQRKEMCSYQTVSPVKLTLFCKNIFKGLLRVACTQYLLLFFLYI